MKHKTKYTQLTMNFEENVNIIKQWWSGIPCKAWDYFDLLANNIELEDISKPWLIEDYKNTLITKK